MGLLGFVSRVLPLAASHCSVLMSAAKPQAAGSGNPTVVQTIFAVGEKWGNVGNPPPPVASTLRRAARSCGTSTIPGGCCANRSTFAQQPRANLRICPKIRRKDFRGGDFCL